GEFAAAGPVRGHQQDVVPGEVCGEVGAGGLVGGVVGWGAADAAVLVVLVQRGGVASAEAERGGAFPGGGEPDRFGEVDGTEPVGEPDHGGAGLEPKRPVPWTAASCSWSPARISLHRLRAAYLVRAARWVMEIMEPSSARISEPGRIRPSFRSASRRVVFAVTWMPAARSSLVAFWEVAV